VGCRHRAVGVWSRPHRDCAACGGHEAGETLPVTTLFRAALTVRHCAAHVRTPALATCRHEHHGTRSRGAVCERGRCLTSFARRCRGRANVAIVLLNGTRKCVLRCVVAGCVVQREGHEGLPQHNRRDNSVKDQCAPAACDSHGCRRRHPACCRCSPRCEYRQRVPVLVRLGATVATGGNVKVSVNKSRDTGAKREMVVLHCIHDGSHVVGAPASRM
jgi:hypothetical protein